MSVYRSEEVKRANIQLTDAVIIGDIDTIKSSIAKGATCLDYAMSLTGKHGKIYAMRVLAEHGVRNFDSAILNAKCDDVPQYLIDEIIQMKEEYAKK